MTILRWRKIIIKDRIQKAGGEQVRHRVYIALANKDTGEYLISPFSDFLNQYSLNKATSASMAADVVVRFLNYLYFTANKDVFEITIQDTADFMDTLNIKQDTQKSYTSYLTKFYYFAAINLSLQYISLTDFNFDKDKRGHMILRNLFIEHIDSKRKINPELLHNIKKEYLYTFVKTAIDATPDIALGIFLQLFGGLRKSEVISLEYKDIATTTIGEAQTIQVTLKDKDLREDIPTAFVAKCKRNRTQLILPVFDDMIWMLYEKHREKYKKEGCSAVFVNSNGKAMTDATYYKRFRKLKEEFIRRLKEADDFDAKRYGFFLSSYKWSTHICRGVFSNLVAELTDNIMEIATWRGDKSLSAALSYLTDRQQTGEKVVQAMNELYKKKEEVIGCRS